MKRFWQESRRLGEPGSGKPSRAPRLRLEIPLSFRFLKEDSWHEAKTENISLTGVLFHAGANLEVKTPIEMRFEWPIEIGGTGGVVICQGEIVRTVLAAQTDARPAFAAKILESRPATASLPDVRRIVGDDRGPMPKR